MIPLNTDNKYLELQNEKESAVMRFLPPLIITENETTEVLNIFEKSVVEAIQMINNND